MSAPRRFVANQDLRRTYVEIPEGQPFTIPSTTLHIARDARGREVGYYAEDGVGPQYAHGADQ